MDLTPAIKAYVEEKLGSVARFLKKLDAHNSAILRVELARTTKHHQKGEVFYAEANLDIPGGIIRAEAFNHDARLAVNSVKRTLELEIKKHKDRFDKKRGRGTKAK